MKDVVRECMAYEIEVCLAMGMGFDISISRRPEYLRAITLSGFIRI
jgi:hypothetical protein